MKHLINMPTHKGERRIWYNTLCHNGIATSDIKLVSIRLFRQPPLPLHSLACRYTPPPTPPSQKIPVFFFSKQKPIDRVFGRTTHIEIYVYWKPTVAHSRMLLKTSIHDMPGNGNSVHILLKTVSFFSGKSYSWYVWSISVKSHWSVGLVTLLHIHLKCINKISTSMNQS